MTTGSRDRFADEQQVLTTAQLEDVAVPVTEPRRGFDGGQVVGLFQPRQQFPCTPQNDHETHYGTTLRART
jgi:hypothetical protein